MVKFLEARGVQNAADLNWVHATQPIDKIQQKKKWTGPTPKEL